MAKLANHMTRVVLIGELDSYDIPEGSFVKGVGRVNVGKGNKIKFTVFNNDREGAKNPHTNASDIAEKFEKGDLIYITGQDNRTVASSDAIYEDVMTWDYRKAEEEEMQRAVFVYVADVKELSEDFMLLSFINYKNEEIEFPITIEKSTKVPHGLEVGDRVKVKGLLFNGLVEDFYGDGEFKTLRTAAEIKIENTKAEIEAEQQEEQETDSESGLW